MKTYHIYIESHTSAPDFEDFIATSTREDAINYWYESYLDLDKETLSKYICYGEEDCL